MTSLALMVSGALARLASTYPSNPKVLHLRKALLATGPLPVEASARVSLAVQSVEDPFYFALFGAIVSEAKRHRDVDGALVVVRATSGAIGTGWRARIQRSVPVTWILSTQWVRAFAGLADRIAFRSHSWGNPLHDLSDWMRSLLLWWKLRSNPDQEPTVSVLGVPVGDLLSDSYLRFRPSPRFRAGDPFVVRLLWQAHRAVRRARRYFADAQPAIYLTSYATYVEHGVPVRVALEQGIKVYSFGSLNRFEKLLTPGDWFHTANCESYRDQFARLSETDRRLAEAETQLRTRLTGGIDAATTYMKASAYASGAHVVPDGVHGSVVVFLHDFYDSPHIFPDILFPDFWRWVCFTIEALQRAGVPFFLKPHPNQVELSADAISELRAAYPAARFLDPGITNAQLAEAGLACGVTVYGTVAHELAYLGVPSIGCARHPHSAFGFCLTPKTRDEYGSMLQAAHRLQVDKQVMRREALSFYYMHNLHGDEEELELRRSFVALWKVCQDPSSPPEAVVSELGRLRTTPAFARRVKAILETRTHEPA